MGAKEMPGSGRILSSFSFFFFLVVRPLAVNGYVFPFSFVFPIHSIHPWPSLSVFFSFLGQVVDDRMVETSTSQILPTVTNDFLFHFLKVTVGKVKVWLVERERQAGIGLLLAMNRFQANLLYLSWNPNDPWVMASVADNNIVQCWQMTEELLTLD